MSMGYMFRAAAKKRPGPVFAASCKEGKMQILLYTF